MWSFSRRRRTAARRVGRGWAALARMMDRMAHPTVWASTTGDVELGGNGPGGHREMVGAIDTGQVTAVVDYLRGVDTNARQKPSDTRRSLMHG